MRLHCDNVTLAVPGRVLSREIAFTAAAGEVWAVLGANGSGKTTLLHALAGLGAPAAGAVRWDGGTPQARSQRARAREVGLLLQHEDESFWGSTRDYARLGRFPHARGWFGWHREDDARAEEALDAVELGAFGNRSYATLSGGERQRARIAQLLAQEPDAFLLDEPLQHLDLKHQARVLALLRRLAREASRTIVMVLHDPLWPARACSHALLMFEDASTVAGPVRDVLTRLNLERLYGCPLQAFDAADGRYFLPHV